MTNALETLTLAVINFKIELEVKNPDLVIDIHPHFLMLIRKDKEIFKYYNTGPRGYEHKFMGYPLNITDDINEFKITVKGN